MIWKVREKIVTFDRTLLMGVMNVTPDSFSDGGRFKDAKDATEYAIQLAADGADIIDLGGESTRPGAESVTVKTELERILPIVKGLRGKTSVLLSIDTMKPEVARKCLEAGADIINNVGLLKNSSKKMMGIIKEFGAGLVLMHSRGTPQTMQGLAEYQELTAEILKEIAENVEVALQGGVDRERIMIDPGIGFAKTAEQNLEIIRNLKPFLATGYPVLLGPSRKSFIGKVTGREPADRDFGTAACVALCVTQGVQAVRVHNVKAMRDVVKMTEAIIKK